MAKPTKKRTGAGNPLTIRSRAPTNVVLTLLVAVFAVVVIGAVLLFNRTDTPAPGRPSPAGGVAADALRQPDSHTLQQAGEAKVTVVEFLDYQCPACAGYYRNVTSKLERDYAGRITFVTRNFPLPMHPLAVPAARAAEAAAAQGKYREMYHALYDSYPSWALAPDGSQVSADTARAQARFDDLARLIGLDLDRFHRDSNSDAIGQRIERDRTDANTAGVTGTPTIFVNGTEFNPNADSWTAVDQQLRARIDQGLAP